MRCLAHLLLLAAAPVWAGVIEGVTLEAASGLPLARTRIRLLSIGTAGVTEFGTQLTSPTGGFVFHGLPDGLYLVIGARPSYHPAAYGQRRPSGAGAPITVGRDSTLFAELRLHKLPAISGRVLDENRIGVPGVPVLAYAVTKPLRPLASAISDDRGVYRIHSLKPGKYFVRTASFRLEDDTGLTPTFGPESAMTRDARIYEARMDSETPDADVRPIAGRLFTLQGGLSCASPGGPTVTISSETMRREVRAHCLGGYFFQGLTAGRYEILAEMPETGFAGFAAAIVSGPVRLGQLQLKKPADVKFELYLDGGLAPSDLRATFIARRRDLHGVGETKQITGPLAPGRWELQAVLPAGYFMTGISGYRRTGSDGPDTHPDWFEIELRPDVNPVFHVEISRQGAKLAGRITESEKPVPGVPVFLLPVTESARRAIQGPKQTYADVYGNYEFAGLPPGAYKVLASVDYLEPTEEMVEDPQARGVTLSAGQAATVDLVLLAYPGR